MIDNRGWKICLETCYLINRIKLEYDLNSNDAIEGTARLINEKNIYFFNLPTYS